jgi:hypothetical protein
MKLAVTITWSKIMAFLMLLCAFVLDLINKGSTTFMFAVPFVVSLILGKQYFDKNKSENIIT